MPRNEINAAVRSLRNRLGDTQQQFANRLGTAISTVVRYELNRPPRGKALVDLETLAIASGCFSEAAIFRTAFWKEFWFQGFAIGRFAKFPYLRLTPQNSREEELVQSVLWATRYSPDRAVLENIEEQLKSYRVQKAEFDCNIDNTAVRLTMDPWAEKDWTAEDLANETDTTPEFVRLWLTIRDKVGKDLTSVRTLLQGMALDESDSVLAANSRLPISKVRELKKFRPLLLVKIPKKVPDADYDEVPKVKKPMLKSSRKK